MRYEDIPSEDLMVSLLSRIEAELRRGEFVEDEDEYVRRLELHRRYQVLIPQMLNALLGRPYHA